MSAQRVRLLWILLLSGVVSGIASAPARAQGHLGLSAGIYQSDEEDADSTEVFGVRGGYRFHPRFGFEASISRVDLADAIPLDAPTFPGFSIDFEADLTLFDFSLQWFPGEGDFVIFGGPGAALLDAEVRGSFLGTSFSEEESVNLLTVHAGLGYSWRIGERFFIRPEGRVRHFFDDEVDESEEGLSVAYEATDYEIGVTFGWRFGN